MYGPHVKQLELHVIEKPQPPSSVCGDRELKSYKKVWVKEGSRGHHTRDREWRRASVGLPKNIGCRLVTRSTTKALFLFYSAINLSMKYRVKLSFSLAAVHYDVMHLLTFVF
jgi:hypothetical protein